MDTSDFGIIFDSRGWCDYCNNFHKNILPKWNFGKNHSDLVEKKISEIKKDGKNNDFDCILGISGGVDSSYMAHLAKVEFGLKPLIFHVDAGWNSKQAVHNIESIVEGLGLDLYTEVINWQEMRDLQLAYFKAQVPHLDTPQDHAFFASLYNFASKYKIKHILNGGNYSTECVREPLEWAYHASDLIQLNDIHKKYGTRKLSTFPKSDIFTYKIYYRFFKNIKVWRPLNLVPYVKEEAIKILINKYGWERYPHKHYESRFTKFYEGYWQPAKFGYDKRKAHFSSLILTNQMTRQEALEKISKPAYDPQTIHNDFEYIANKLEITYAELEEIFAGENKNWWNYKSRMSLISIGAKILRIFGVQRSIIR